MGRSGFGPESSSVKLTDSIPWAEATETTVPIGVSNLRRDTASVLGVFCFKAISKNNKNRSECLKRGG
ncbi:MAG: hypothetical protein A2W97_14155 [Bacteroidetes bacterium GWE2_40_63]|nr:MAG: hypothetical protein A2W96_14710 [Bacteroidetes bacterium GWD2_40_43]OFX89493.1 MAG: hypothetical protein A2W97_14155 [Bacteroidetes bacterium GWE2_40_63]